MNRLGPWLLGGGAILAVLFVFLVPDWRLPGGGTELATRAASQVQFTPTAAEAQASNPAPPRLPVVADDPRPASAVYKNVKLLGDMNAGDFMRLQNAMTAWVSPREGCGFCHAGTDYASEAKPAKQAARVMLGMTRHINTTWKSHVGEGGVTCFSCHRGQPIPSEVWYQSPPRAQPAGVSKQDDWNEAARTVRGFFPNQGYEEYLLQNTPAHGAALTVLPRGGSPHSTEVARLYEAMMQMSDSMGVNCGYCHQSRDFADWNQSTPMRWTGYTGIVMTRDINRDYLLHLAQVAPLTRIQSGHERGYSLPDRYKGAQIGNGLADCATCHHGAPKPVAGEGLAKAFPALSGPAPSQVGAVAALAPAATPR